MDKRPANNARANSIGWEAADKPDAHCVAGLGHGSLAFLEEGVEKPVVIVRCATGRWQELTVDGRRGQEAVEARCATRRGGAVRKRADLIAFVLGPKDRARRIEQHAAALQARPQRIEQAALLRDEAGDIGLAAQPFARPDAGARRPTRYTARRPGCDRMARRPTMQRSRLRPRRKTFARNPRRIEIVRTRGRGALRRRRARSGRASRARPEWVVLPPGAAQASSTRMPSCAVSSGAASCAPAS